MHKVEIRPGVWMAYEDHWFGKPWTVPDTVVMVHGNSESSRAWTAWVPHLAGKYRVERVLGQGGMGVVVKAMHLQLNQPVAMKFLLPEVLGNQQIVQRFLREAQAAVRLKSEHVARVIDVGALETGAPYMVLEYLEGAPVDIDRVLVGELVHVLLARPLRVVDRLGEIAAGGGLEEVVS